MNSLVFCFCFCVHLQYSISSTKVTFKSHRSWQAKKVLVCVSGSARGALKKGVCTQWLVHIKMNERRAIFLRLLNLSLPLTVSLSRLFEFLFSLAHSLSRTHIHTRARARAPRTHAHTPHTHTTHSFIWVLPDSLCIVCIHACSAFYSHSLSIVNMMLFKKKKKKKLPKGWMYNRSIVLIPLPSSIFIFFK